MQHFENFIFFISKWKNINEDGQGIVGVDIKSFLL